jgi:hypothetical protein
VHFVGAVPCEVLAGLQALLRFAVGFEDEAICGSLAARALEPYASLDDLRAQRVLPAL